MFKNLNIYLFLISSFFAYIISLDKNNSFNPIPPENGIIHQNYSHNSNDNLYFIFSHFSNGFTSPSFLKDDGLDILGGEWMNPDELTNEGKKDLYYKGKYDLIRYQNFLNLHNFDEIKIFSVNSTKAKLSAESKLCGLFNISIDSFEKIIHGKETISKNLIPEIILTEKKEEKKIFGIFQKIKDEPILKYLFDCPVMKNKIKINKLEKSTQMKYLKNSFYSEFSKDSELFFNFTFDINSYKGIYSFCDAYISNLYKPYNFEVLYKFYKKNKIIEKYCYNIFALSDYYIKFDGHAKKNPIIIMSETMLNLVDIMERKILNQDNEKIKMIMLSGLVESISAMQTFLKIGFNTEYEWAPFNSDILFELRKYGNDFYIEIYYNDLLQMNITFEVFKEIIKKISYNEREINMSCYIISPYNSDLFIFIIAFSIIIISATLILKFYILI